MKHHPARVRNNDVVVICPACGHRCPMTVNALVACGDMPDENARLPTLTEATCLNCTRPYRPLVKRVCFVDAVRDPVPW